MWLFLYKGLDTRSGSRGGGSSGGSSSGGSSGSRKEIKDRRINRIRIQRKENMWKIEHKEIGQIEEQIESRKK